MGGFLVSPNYVPDPAGESDKLLAGIVLGFALGFGTLTCVKAFHASCRAWGRSRRANIYVCMIWGEVIATIGFGLLGWLRMTNVLRPSFWAFFAICTFWSFQIQLLLQIIINRVSVIMPDQRQAAWIKWSVATFVTLLNISVYCIWIPARLQISPRWVALNLIWDRVEKILYAICDAGLNIWFLILVKRTFIDNGLTKYITLFRWNACAVVCSLAMDLLIIGSMSLDNHFMYVMFHPVAYGVKLNIELTMADLIAKVARASNQVQFLSEEETLRNRSVAAGMGGMDWRGTDANYAPNSNKLVTINEFAVLDASTQDLRKQSTVYRPV